MDRIYSANQRQMSSREEKLLDLIIQEFSVRQMSAKILLSDYKRVFKWGNEKKFIRDMESISWLTYRGENVTVPLFSKIVRKNGKVTSYEVRLNPTIEFLLYDNTFITDMDDLLDVLETYDFHGKSNYLTVADVKIGRF